MKFKVSNIEKCFGMSPNGIRLYEKYGIIKPERELDSNYRIFGFEEAFSLLRSMQYRSIGFTLKQTSDIISTGDIETQLGSLKERNSSLIDEIEYKLHLKSFQETQIQLITNIVENQNVCNIINIPDMYFVKMFDLEQERINDKIIPIISNWSQKYVPFAAPAFMYPKVFFEQSQDNKKMNAHGAVIEKKIAEFLNMPMNEDILILPSGPCIQTIVKYSVSDYYKVVNISHVLDYIQNNNLKIAGDACSRFITGEKTDKNHYRYDILWVPVQLK